MERGASTWPRLQAVSQGWKQTRPQIAAKGMRSRTSAKASSYLPIPVRVMYPMALTPAGHCASQGGAPARRMEYVLGMAWGNGRLMGWRLAMPSSNSEGNSTGQTCWQSPQPVHLSVLT